MVQCSCENNVENTDCQQRQKKRALKSLTFPGEENYESYAQSKIFVCFVLLPIDLNCKISDVPIHAQIY